MLVCVPSADSKSVVKEPSEDGHDHEKGYIITCQRALCDVSCEPLDTWTAQACWLDRPGMADYLLVNKEDLLMPSFPDYGCVLCRCPKALSNALTSMRVALAPL